MSSKIIYRKKSIDNGDLSKHFKKSTALQNTLQKINQKMDSFNQKIDNKKSDDSNKMLSKSRKEKEKSDFLCNVKTVQKDQEKLVKNLRQVPFDKNNKNNFFISSQKLPKTIDEIEENTELVKMLLKNPQEMTPEEKAYISSFNKEEFKRFIQFLKLKDREIKWRGNDYGSGHYLEAYMTIYRQTGHSENVL